MANENKDEPRDLCYEDKNTYKWLTEERTSPFCGKQFNEIFLLAMAYGKKFGEREKLKERYPNIPLRTFLTEELWLIKAVAMSESNSLDILLNQKELYKIAEEYANNGVKLLKQDIVDNLGDYDKLLETKIKKSKK